MNWSPRASRRPYSRTVVSGCGRYEIDIAVKGGGQTCVHATEVYNAWRIEGFGLGERRVHLAMTEGPAGKDEIKALCELDCESRSGERLMARENTT